MISAGLATAFAMVLGAPLPRVPNVVEGVAVRTTTDAYVSRRLGFADGMYRFHDGERERVVEEADLVHAAFLPSLDRFRAFSRLPDRRVDPVVAFAVRVADPGGLGRADVFGYLFAKGGVFLRPGEDPAALVPRFAHTVRSPYGIALLGYEAIEFYAARQEPRAALAVLEKAESGSRDPKAATAFGLLHAALAYKLKEPDLRAQMERLFERYGQEPEFRRFREIMRLRTGQTRRRRGPLRPGPRPGRERGDP